MEKILIVDDSPVVCKVLKAMLEENDYTVLTAENGQQAISALQEEDSPDLILLDRVMPDMDGIEVCKWARNNICPKDGSKYKYFIILTAKGNQSDVLEGFAGGADDYICKPFDKQELVARVAVGSRVLDLQRKLWNAAIRDALTGLYNRRFLFELLEAEFSRARRENSLVAVAIADIDHFKRVNDVFGHVVGDEAIIVVAERIRDVVRDFDLVGRMGGEEFIIACSCSDEAGAADIFERVRQAISDNCLVCDGAEFNLTISVGVATVTGEVKPSDAIRRADMALYQAKEKGRNCVVHFRPVLDT